MNALLTSNTFFEKGLSKRSNSFEFFQYASLIYFALYLKLRFVRTLYYFRTPYIRMSYSIRICRAFSRNVYKRLLLVLIIANFQRLPYQVQKRCMLQPILSITFLRPRYYIVMIFFINNGCLLLYIGSVSFRFKDHLLGIAKSLRLIMKTLRIAFEHLKPYGINQKTSSIYSDIFITATIYLYNQSKGV